MGFSGVDPTPYLNLALNVLTLVVVVALAVWLRRSHIQVVELKGQLLGVIMSLRLMVNGESRSEPVTRPKDAEAVRRSGGDSGADR